jgi:bifunctional DNase/RNase
MVAIFFVFLQKYEIISNKSVEIMKKHNEFKTLAVYGSIEEAQVIKALLDSMGVENQITNDTAVMVMPYLGKDVKIIVNAVDYDRARALLDAGFDHAGIVAREKK